MLDLFPQEIISVVENIYIHQEQMTRLSNFAQDWQSLFMALPEGEQLVVELLRHAHVKIMFYLALLHVCLSRSSASLLLAPFVGDVTADILVFSGAK